MFCRAHERVHVRVCVRVRARVSLRTENMGKPPQTKPGLEVMIQPSVVSSRVGFGLLLSTADV